MATWLKQSTAVEIKLGPFLDETDGATAMTGLTIEDEHVDLAKNGGDWGDKAETTTLVHESQGWYRCLLDTTDTNTLGILIAKSHVATALPVWREFMVVPANVYDALVGGSVSLLVDVNAISGDTGAATNLEAMFDGTGYTNDKAPATQEMALEEAEIETAIETAVFTKVAEGSYTFLELIRGWTAVLLGKASGLATTTVIYKNTGDDVDVITATVDGDGNRSAVTLDLTDTP